MPTTATNFYTMASKVSPAVKSILKQPSTRQNKANDEQKAKLERDRHNLKIALYHAYRIQDQKKVQAEILGRIEGLIDLPASSTFTVQEAKHFSSAIDIFQPSDLGDLIEERRVGGRCGYVVCLNAPRAMTAPAWITSKGGADYCSDICVKKMLYVKTQLSEVPAWERGANDQPDIILHPDDQLERKAVKEVAGPKRKQLIVAHDEELAFERGETKASFRPRQVMTDKIVEKAITSKPNVANVDQSTSHTAIEGYEPRSKLSRKEAIDSDSEDESGDDG